MRTIKNKSVRGIFAAGLLFTASMFLGAGSLSAQSVKTIYIHGVYPNITSPDHLINCHLKTYGTGTCKKSSSGVWWPLYTNGSGYWWPKGNNGKQVFVGYDGRMNPFSWNSKSGRSRLLDALNKHCRKDQGKYCRIVSHSMGSLVTAYVLRYYANSYNIMYHTTLSSAENGSLLADLAVGILGGTLAQLNFAHAAVGTNAFNSAVFQLTRSNARNKFNHNISNGVTTYHIAAKKSFWLVDIIMKGKHDRVVTYSSQCGYPIIASFTKCGGQDPSIWKPYTKPYTGHKAHPWLSTSGVNGKTHTAGNHDSLTQWYYFGYSSSL